MCCVECWDVSLDHKYVVFTTCSFKLRRFCRQGSLSWSCSWWDEQGRTLGGYMWKHVETQWLGENMMSRFLVARQVFFPENIPWHPNCQIVKLAELSKGKMFFEKDLIYFQFCVSLICFFMFFFQLEIRYLDKHQHIFSCWFFNAIFHRKTISLKISKKTGVALEKKTPGVYTA